MLGVAGSLSLTLLVCAPLLDGRRTPESTPAALALVGYLFGAMAAADLGEFPVPLLGFAPSATLGVFLGFAALRR